MRTLDQIASRRKREEWLAMAERFRRERVTVRARPERPEDATQVWSDHGYQRRHQPGPPP